MYYIDEEDLIEEDYEEKSCGVERGYYSGEEDNLFHRRKRTSRNNNQENPDYKVYEDSYEENNDSFYDDY